MKEYVIDKEIMEPVKLIVSTPASAPSQNGSKIDTNELKATTQTEQILEKIDRGDNFFDMIHEEYKKAEKRPRN